MSDFDFLTVQTDKTPITFMLSWHIAREHYVVARVSFQQGMTYPSCLLAQQSVEMFVKAILHLDHKSKGIHYLPDLLKRGKEKVAYFNKLLKEPKLSYFIQNLILVNTKMRFGEVGYTVKSDELVQVLDEIAFNLDKSYREVMKNKEKCPLYVPDTMNDAFLRDNKYFSEKDISNNFMARISMP